VITPCLRLGLGLELEQEPGLGLELEPQLEQELGLELEQGQLQDSESGVADGKAMKKGAGAVVRGRGRPSARVAGSSALWEKHTGSMR